MIANTTYKMTVDCAAIKRSTEDLSYTPEAVNVAAYTQSGSTLTPYMAFFTFECLQKSWYTDLEINRESLAYTPPADVIIDAVRVSMYEYESYAAGEGILLDQIIIPVVHEKGTSEETDTDETGISLFYAYHDGNDSTHQIPKSSMAYDAAPKTGDLILKGRGYLYCVTGTRSDTICVSHVGKTGEEITEESAGDSTTRVPMLIGSTEAGTYATTEIPYDTITLPASAGSLLNGDIFLCTNGTLFECVSQSSSGANVSYIGSIGTEGTSSRGAMLFFSTETGNVYYTSLLYAYNLSLGGFIPAQGDLIITADNKLYIVESVNSYHVTVAYLQTLYI